MGVQIGLDEGNASLHERIRREARQMFPLLKENHRIKQLWRSLLDTLVMSSQEELSNHLSHKSFLFVLTAIIVAPSK